MVLAGCGTGAKTASTTDQTGESQTGGRIARARAGEVSARSGGLTVRLAVAPTLVAHGSVVRIEIVAHEQNARGAVGYLLRYGDGTTTGSGPVPQFCLSGENRPASQSWRLTHRYPTKGRHVVSASVYVNCTRERATVMVPLLVS
jgi:hypothetical protein